MPYLSIFVRALFTAVWGYMCKEVKDKKRRKCEYNEIICYIKITLSPWEHHTSAFTSLKYIYYVWISPNLEKKKCELQQFLPYTSINFITVAMVIFLVSFFSCKLYSNHIIRNASHNALATKKAYVCRTVISHVITLFLNELMFSIT